MAYTDSQERMGTPLPLKPLVLSDQAFALPLWSSWSQRNKISVCPLLFPKAGLVAVVCMRYAPSPEGSPTLYVTFTQWLLLWGIADHDLLLWSSPV